MVALDVEIASDAETAEAVVELDAKQAIACGLDYCGLAEVVDATLIDSRASAAARESLVGLVARVRINATGRSRIVLAAGSCGVDGPVAVEAQLRATRLGRWDVVDLCVVVCAK